MQNIGELREDLLQNYEKIKSKELSLKEGKELANIAGKVLGTLKLELEYNQWTDNKKQIPFLDVPEKTK